MYKMIYILHLLFSFFLIIIIFLQKGSLNVTHGYYDYFRSSNYVSKKFLLNTFIIFLLFFLITNFFLVYVFVNSLNLNEDLLEFNMLLFSNKYFDAFFLEDFRFPLTEPIWWNMVDTLF